MSEPYNDGILWINGSRNPERIPLVLSALEMLWSQNPDLRLGQLLRNVMVGDFDKFHLIEDDKLQHRFEERINKGK